MEHGMEGGAASRLLRVALLILLALVVLVAGKSSTASAAATCPNEELRGGPSGQLPDCRAYEMVSPADMNGNGIDQAYAVRDDGEAVVYGTLNIFGTEAGSSITGKWVATRGPGGWTSASLNPAALGRNPTPYDQPVAMDFSDDLSSGIFGTRYPFDPRDQSPYFSGAKPGNADLYLFSTGPASDWISHGTAVPTATTLERALGGASEDLSRIFFETKEPLTAAAEGSTDANLYERRGGTLASVNVDGTGTLVPGGAGVGRGQAAVGAFYSAGEFQQGSSKQGHATDRTAVSEDGRVVYFTAPVQPTSAPRQLYARVAGAATVQVSRCEFGACAGAGAPSGALFLVASPDGGTALFFSQDQLLETAPAEGGIYSFDLATESLSFLTTVGTATASARRGGVLAATPDLSTLYLCDSANTLSVHHEGERKTIAPIPCNASTGGDGSIEPTAERSGITVNGVKGITAQGEPELTPNAGYAFATTAGPREVPAGEAQVAAGEQKIDEGEEALANGETAQGESLIRVGEAEVAAGERKIAAGETFGGYENAGFSQVYLYEPDTGTHRCLSCRPDGSTAEGNAYLNDGVNFFNNRLLSGVSVRNVTEGGNRAFFVSEDQLVPRDVNGVSDVYEWERNGTGTCTVASPTYTSFSDGCVFLISSGTDSNGGVLQGVSADGEDVFFSSGAQLVPANTGTELQLFNARIGGGIAAQHASPQPGCVGEACRVPGTPGLLAPAPSAASASYLGEGNAKPRRRCVKAGKRKRKASRHTRGKTNRRKASSAQRKKPRRANCKRATGRRGGK